MTRPASRPRTAHLLTLALASLNLSAASLAQPAGEPSTPTASHTVALSDQGVATLRGFLASLDGSPELGAAEAALEAAELQLRAAYDPVVLEASGGYSRFALDDALSPAQLPEVEIPEVAAQLGATLVFRPYPFGDVADGVRGRELEVRVSLLELREARAGLEARALQAALSAALAERSIGLAEEGVRAARQGLEATEVRFTRGGANARDLREARSALLEAEALLQNAQTDAATARLNLQALVGDTPTPGFETLAALRPPEGGLPATLQRAEVPALQAELAASAAQRALLPVAQASYTWNVSDKGTLTASLESRTLQPSVGFSYQDPGRSFPENAVQSSLTLGVSANLSVGAFSALEATGRQVEAAQAGLSAAREGAALQEAALRAAHANAERDLQGSRRAFTDAEATYTENEMREGLGLASPLETQGSLLELLQADLSRRSAELAALSAVLDLYTFYALPLSETLP